MATLVKPEQVQIGDRIRFSSEVLALLSTWGIEGDTEFRTVTSIRVEDRCPEEKFSFHFSKIPGDCIIVSENYKVEFPIEVA